MFANYHTHTMRCLHADGTDREYVEAAIESGLQVLGFSDHCPWVYPDSYVSFMRMPASAVDDYFDSLTSLKKEYFADIKILIGFEAEYIPELIEEQDKLLANYPLDYMILGQHCLGHEAHSVYTGQPSNDAALLKQYVDTVIEGLESGRYLYVAHPDVIHFTGADALYEKHMSRLCQYLKEKDIPIEINMLGLYQGRHYPSDRFLSIAERAGNSCIIGIDAHTPHQLENKAAEKNCLQLIARHNLKLIETLDIQ